MQWLERDFLGYLDHWEESVWAREGFTPGEKAMMLLSRETREGLRMTGVHHKEFSNVATIHMVVHNGVR